MGKYAKKKRRARKLTRHHIINRFRGGTSSPENIILLKNERHEIWHILFHNLDFLEAANLLIRADRMLKRKEIKWEMLKS